MGNYVYALRSPTNSRTCLVTLTDGSVFTVLCGSMSYLYKPSYSNELWNGKYYRIAARLEKIWSDSRQTRPAYVVFTDEKNNKIKIGQNVYNWPGHNEIPLTYNDGSELLKRVGVVTRIYGK